AQKARHNEIHVEYVDASDSYERKIEVVSDDDLIRRHGLNVKKVTAFACTSRGQAFRTGKWILETERLETKTVTFAVGAEGLMHIPGDVIRVADCDYADTNIGGRVLAVNGRNVTLDKEISLWSNSYLTYIDGEAKHKDIRIVSKNGKEVTLESEPVGLAELGVWSLTTQEINVQLFRALTINEEKQGQYTIVALQHEPQKEAIVDNGAVFEPRETTLSTAGLDKVSHVNVQANGDGIALSFDYIVKHSAMIKYQIKLYKDGTFYKVYDDLTTPNHKFVGLPDGEYVAEIRAKNEQGQLSEAVTKSFNISFTVTELTTVSKVLGILLQWKNPVFANPNSAIEIWTNTEDRFETARKLVTLAYPTNSYSFDGLGVNETHYFWARMLDTANGNAGELTTSVVGVTESSGEKLVDYLQGQISRNAFSQALAEEITQIEKTGKRNESSMRKMQVFKTETHASSGRKLIAGIALGVDGETEESQVIISAEKFVIADPNSNTLKMPFTVSTENGQARIAIAGDLIVKNSITGDKIQANTTITSPKIEGGHIKGNTFEGGVIRGARIEGLTGKFTGELEVTQIVGGNVLEVFTCTSTHIGVSGATNYGESPRYHIRYMRKIVKVLINSANVDRELFIIDPLSSISGRAYTSIFRRPGRRADDNDYTVSETIFMPGIRNLQARITLPNGVINEYKRSISIPRNETCAIDISYETLSDTSVNEDTFTFIAVVKSTSSKTISKV
ncbi:phage tail protein, partial [Pasteurella multocida]